MPLNAVFPRFGNAYPANTMKGAFIFVDVLMNLEMLKPFVTCLTLRCVGSIGSWMGYFGWCFLIPCTLLSVMEDIRIGQYWVIV